MSTPREIRFAIMGPPRSGRSTALRTLMRQIPRAHRGEIVEGTAYGVPMLSAEILLPEVAGRHGQSVVTIATLSGGELVSAAVEQLLTDVHGVAFLADDRKGRDEVNRGAWQEMMDAFATLDQDPSELAFAAFLNRRDGDDPELDESMSGALEPFRGVVVEGDAHAGTGLMQLLRALVDALDGEGGPADPVKPLDDQVGEAKGAAAPDDPPMPMPGRSKGLFGRLKRKNRG